jgi:hypothetical protein
MALACIVEEIERSAKLVNNIAIASKEQASAIEQINMGINQVSQVVQATPPPRKRVLPPVRSFQGRPHSSRK